MGTRDFSAILLKVQQIKADVIAPAIGGDDFKSMRQQVIDRGWIASCASPAARCPTGRTSRPLGSAGVFGVFPTNWYHYLDLPGVADFTAKYKRKFPSAPEPVPGNVFYNGYYAMRELIRAVERVGSTNNLKIIKALEGRMTARDRMQHHDAWIDPGSHHVQQTIYVGARNFEPRDPTDLFKIIGTAKPEDVVSETEKDCKLETYEATPSYEM